MCKTENVHPTFSFECVAHGSRKMIHIANATTTVGRSASIRPIVQTHTHIRVCASMPLAFNLQYFHRFDQNYFGLCKQKSLVTVPQAIHDEKHTKFTWSTWHINAVTRPAHSAHNGEKWIINAFYLGRCSQLRVWNSRSTTLSRHSTMETVSVPDWTCQILLFRFSVPKF